jgi:hypothetical protein
MAKLSLPGLALASATSSRRFLRRAPRVRHQHRRRGGHHGERVKSFSGSKGSVGYRLALIAWLVKLMSSVLPSGADLATASAAMLPPAPGGSRRGRCGPARAQLDGERARHACRWCRRPARRPGCAPAGVALRAGGGGKGRRGQQQGAAGSWGFRLSRCSWGLRRPGRPAAVRSVASSASLLARELHAAVLQHVGALGDLQRLRHVLLHQQDRQAAGAAADQPNIPRPAAATGPARARRGSAGAARPSGRGRWPASAARRRSWCRRAARCAPSGAGRCANTLLEVGRAVGARAGEGAELQVLQHRQVGEDLAAFGHVDQAGLTTSR